MTESDKGDGGFDLTLENIAQPECIGYIGAVAAKSLNEAGCAVFVVDSDGSIVLVNPTRAFFDHSALTTPPGKKAVMTRPVIMDGRPQQVALREDGSFWEVELVDDEGDEDGHDKAGASTE